MMGDEAMRAAMDALANQPVGDFAAGLSEQVVEAGQLLMREGEPADAAYVVLEGIARAERRVGEEVTLLSRRGAGHCIGEAALLSGGKRTCDVRAETDLRLMRIDAETFRSWYESSAVLRGRLGAVKQLYAQPNGGLVTLHDLGDGQLSATQTAADGRRHVVTLREGHLHLGTASGKPDQVVAWEQAPQGKRRELHLVGDTLIGVVAHQDDASLLQLARLAMSGARITQSQQLRFRWTGELAHRAGPGLICPCAGVSEEDVRTLKASGVTQLEEIAARTGATRVCGRCGPGVSALSAALTEGAPPPRPPRAAWATLADVVTPEDLDRSLAQVAAGLSDEDALFDLTGSAAQTAELALLAVGGKATLMQLAWPAVGQAMLDHSDVSHDPSGRFHRTMVASYAMSFGARSTVMETARRLHAIHMSVTGVFPWDVGPHQAGDPYAANEVESLRWVAATLVGSKVDWQRRVHGLSKEDLTRTLGNLRTYCALFGIPPGRVWTDVSALDAWLDQQIATGRLGVSPPVVALAHQLLSPPRPELAPLFRLVKAVTIGLLPPAVARLYGWNPSRRHRAAVAMAVRAARLASRTLPAGLLYAHTYNEALVRTGLSPRLPRGSGRFEEALEASMKRHGIPPTPGGSCPAGKS